ncbi:BlaI/MecI/CopY family transcriptional regulator [Alkalinema pantanalense CENA528]|uniref:BlaI/MecI/CopY family transcriptional regulator n=1 Tax=Alkalinema pantanalense TaxID=1620705 RepID=UPI003D6F96A9
MTGLPNYRPRQLSLGPLEQEILNLVWDLGTATVKDVHQRILKDPDRELAYTSVTTVLKRLTGKGWLACKKDNKIHTWSALISREQARSLQAYEQLNRFLSVGNVDMVAAFADELDQTSLEKLDAIAQRLREIRQQREGQ